MLRASHRCLPGPPNRVLLREASALGTARRGVNRILRRKLPGRRRHDTFLSPRGSREAPPSLPDPASAATENASAQKNNDREAAGREDEGLATPRGRHRPGQPVLRLGRGLAGAPELPDQRRQRRLALPVQPELERLARDPVADVRRHLPARRRLGAEGQRARPRRPVLWLGLAAAQALDRRLRHRRSSCSRRRSSSAGSPGRSSSRASARARCRRTPAACRSGR